MKSANVKQQRNFSWHFYVQFKFSFSLFLSSHSSLHVRALFAFSFIVCFVYFLYNFLHVKAFLSYPPTLNFFHSLYVCDMGNFLLFLLPYLTCVALIVYVQREASRRTVEKIGSFMAFLFLLWSLFLLCQLHEIQSSIKINCFLFSMDFWRVI